MKFDVMELETIIDEEVDVYGINNSLDDETTEELRFIATSFAKFFKGAYASDNNISKILKDFEGSLNVLTSGVFGRSFTTNAALLYRDLPTIKELYFEGVEQLESRIRSLTTSKITLESENKSLKREIESLRTDLKDYKDRLSRAYTKEGTVRRSTPSSSSYGGCGGGSRRSYGGC